MTTGNNPEELADLEPFEGIPNLDDAADLAPAGDAPAPELLEELPEETAAASPESSTGPRELEKAPMMLQKAALVLTVAALLPWLVPGGWLIERVISKLLVCLGGYVLYMGVLHAHDEQVPGVFASIGKMHKSALTLVGTVLMVVAVAPLIDSGPFLTTIVEKAAVAIGLVTWCQVAGYAKGGKFNPMFGLIIPVFALAALGRLATMVSNFDFFALLGSAGVAGAGGLAGYTMFLAMKDAKEHGKKKKQANMERRKAERRKKNEKRRD